MKILRLFSLSLTLAVAIFALGYADPSFAAPKKCDGNPMPIPPGCPKEDPDPEPDPSATFKVEVYFTEAPPAFPEADADGTAPTADGKSNGQRRSVSAPKLKLNLAELDAYLPDACQFGEQTAQFALGTYKNKQTQLFTYVNGDFWNFQVPNAGTGVNYALVFGPEEDGMVVPSGNGWLPSGGITSVSGLIVRLRAQKGSNADDACNMDIPIYWQIDVTDN